MYTVAVTPILVGSTAAYADTHSLSLWTLFVFLTAAVAIIAWLNLTNDVFDFDTGIDVHKQESVVNLCGATRSARNFILLISSVFLIAAFGALATLSSTDGAFDATILAVISVAVTGGYMYQGPPFRLGYYGLGEPICFVTWAISVAAAYYSQISATTQSQISIMQQYPTLSARLLYLNDMFWSRQYSLGGAAFLVAAPTATILFCSHFHQLEDDEKAGKKSPIVRLGTYNASIVLQLILVLFFALQTIFFVLGMVPLEPFALTLLSLPQARQLAVFVSKNHTEPEKVRVAKYYAVKFHFIHGMLLSIGYILTARDVFALG